ncbi:MAG: T9SS type A sorting domain-containing protein, partial [Ignavibacteriaceae bacterium]
TQLPTGINDIQAKVNEFKLYQNYPNPFNPSTKIEYRISEFGLISLKIYDVLGKEVATLVNEEKPAGTYEVTWNAANLPSGVYFYQIKAGSYTATKKLLLLK